MAKRKVNTLEQELLELEKLEKTTIRKLPLVRGLKTSYRRDTTDIHQMSESEIRGLIGAYKALLIRGKGVIPNQVLKDYMRIKKQMRRLARSSKEYARMEIKLREKEYLLHMQRVGNWDYVRARYLLNLMTAKEKREFFTSDAFFKTPDFDSDSWKKFMRDYGYSVEVAKLEDFVKYYLRKDTKMTTTFDRYHLFDEMLYPKRKKKLVYGKERNINGSKT